MSRTTLKEGMKKCLAAMASLLGGITLFSVSSSPAWAFSLGDHWLITQSAISLYEKCHSPLQINATAIGTAVANEDLDLIHKWSNYSHYYNPFKKISMRREDASASTRLAESNSLGAPRWMQWAHLGRALHHIQDMASPPHVIPVEHGLGDGFEKWSPADLRDEIKEWANSDSACKDLGSLSEAASFTQILHENAIETLRSLTAKVPESALRNLSWEQGFWTASDSGSSDFGHYGSLGNTFGDANLMIVSEEAFYAFKRDRLIQAIRSSVRAIYYFENRF